MKCRRVVLLAVVIAIAATTTGCLAPRGGPPPSCYQYYKGACEPAGIAYDIAHAFPEPSLYACFTDIAWRESRFNPGVANPQPVYGGHAYGLLQIVLPLHSDAFYGSGSYPAAWADPYWNALAARWLYNGNGVAPWGSC